MENKAMNLTFGDLLIAEIALVHYVRDLDLSMQCGQTISELIGKLEYAMAQIKLADSNRPIMPLQPPPIPPAAPAKP